MLLLTKRRSEKSQRKAKTAKSSSEKYFDDILQAQLALIEAENERNYI